MRKRVDPVLEVRRLKEQLEALTRQIAAGDRPLTDDDVHLDATYQIQVNEKGRVHYVNAIVRDRGKWERGATLYRLERLDRETTTGPAIFRTADQLWPLDDDEADEPPTTVQTPPSPRRRRP